MRKITLLSFAFLATYSAGMAYAQTEQSDLQTAIANAEKVEAKKGVGYPAENSSARNTLVQAIETAKNALESSTDSENAITTLNAAVTTYKSTTTDIQMPVDGKVYTITAVGYNGGRTYMRYDNDNSDIRIATTTDTTNTNYPVEAKFICRTTTDGKVMFFNSKGVYAVMRTTNGGYNSNKGYADPNDDNLSKYASLTIEKFINPNTQYVQVTQDKLFGFVVMKGLNQENKERILVIKNNTNYDNSGGYHFEQRNATTSFSSALLIEETSFPIAEEASAALEKTGVGYPTADCASRLALTNAVNQYKEHPTGENLINVYSTKDPYLNEVENVMLPEDGKAYTITAVAKNGKRFYMNYSEGGYSLVETQDTNNSGYPMTAIVVCHKLTDNNSYDFSNHVGKYAFSNNAGRYFIWKGNEGTETINGQPKYRGYNSNKGYADSYVANDDKYFSLLVYKPQTTENSSTNFSASQEDIFGYLAIKGQRFSKDELDNFVINVSGKRYDQAGSPFYNDNYTSLLLIEEAEYPNTVKLNDATGIEGIQKIGTFSAPFRTIVPTGVKAYYVSGTESSNGTTATTTAINAGEAIPANTGVLLTTTDADISSATMVPALAETDATIAEGSNLLHASAGASKDIPTTENAYILTKQGDQVAFYLCSQTSRTISMNKSYLVMPTTAAASKFSLNFGTVTGISNLPTVEGAESNAPVYDITGRRVSNLQKGGLYIKGGKKFIVK